jgi:predicted amidohydrolase YtcJ
MTTWVAGRGAELVLVGGKIRTPAHPSGFVQAAAISGGVVVALGRDEDIRDLVRPFTRVVNLNGRLAIPAFGDAHVHPVQGGLESLRCNLAGLRTRHEYLDTIAAYSSALPDGAWVLGGGWSMSAFPGGRPNAADLDLVTGGRPAFLPNRDHHSAWVNAAALDLAGITARTPDPADGRIERDQAGVPVGALHDGAMRLVADYVPAPGQNELTAALLAAQTRLHSLGITSIQDACVGDASDLGRFAELGVTANFQPLWACRDEQNDQLTVPFVGDERAAWQYRIGSFLRHGARVAFGSDWPVSSADPLQEMHVAVNRMLSTRLGQPGSVETTEPLLPDEAITIGAAVDAFTRGVAYVNHEEDVAGTLELGKLADVAVLTQDIYAVPPAAIGDTTVALTVASGQIVHGDQ